MSTVDSLLIVGLGNPGPTYHGNRHNVGQHVLDVLALDVAGNWVRHTKAKAQVLEGRLGFTASGAPGPKVILVKPTTYMNVSGQPVGQLAKFYNLPPSQVLVVHDELDLPEHVLRLKHGGGEGGHNGLKSISAHLGTKDYRRLRVGVGRPPGRMDPADYVLSNFPASETVDWQITCKLAAEAIEQVATVGWAKAQAQLHTNS